MDALVSVTPQIVEKLKCSNPNTVMITNYPILRNKEENTKNRYRGKNICFAGGISPQWNHENIIKAIESIEGVEYILAGDGSKHYLDKLKNLNGWKKVKYLGRIPHTEVAKIYDESMVGMALLSNKSQVGAEGTLGNTKLFEYMEADLPVICSDNNLWKQIIDENQCGITINPENIVEITDAIVQILESPELASQMGDNGRKAIYTEFNWATQEKKLIDLYNSIVRLG